MMKRSQALWRHCEDVRVRSRELRAEGHCLRHPSASAQRDILAQGLSPAAALDNVEAELLVALHDVRRERKRLAEQIRRLQDMDAQASMGPGEVLAFPARPKPN
jgi:hypothetical protein